MDTPNADPARDWLDTTFDWVLVGAGLYLLAHHTYPVLHPVFFGLGLLLPAIGLGRLRQKQWASWGLIVLLVTLTAYPIWQLAHGRFGWFRLVSIPVVGWLAWSEWRSIRRRRARRAHRMVSLVLLEREPRALDAAILPHTIASVWPGDYSSQSEDAPCFVIGEHAPFMVRSPEGLFIIHCLPQPYFDDAGAMLPKIGDLRARQFLQENRAWLSVDWMGAGEPQADEARAYREIGKLVAALAGENTIALFHPDSGRYCPWSQAVARDLADGEGLTVLADAAEPPVVPVEPDNNALALATEEAKRRWPEFVAAFSRRHPEQLFSIKTALTVEGETEHIWVEVGAIDDTTIHGRLGNDPVALEGLKIGDPVTIQVDAVEDWIYLLSNKPVGGFSIAAVQSAQNKIRRSA